MKRYFKCMPYILCALQAVAPVLSVVFLRMGWYAVPAPVTGLTIAAGTMISTILVMANDHMFEPDTAGKVIINLAVWLGLFSSVVMLGTGGVLYIIFAVVNAICCFMLSCYVGGSGLLRLMHGFIMCVVAIIAIIAMGNMLFSDYGLVDYKIVSRYDSPGGRYTAEVIDSDDKMEGAQVRVRMNTLCGIPVTRIFDITRQLTKSSGDRVPGDYVIEWIDNDSLSINGYIDEFD